MDTTENILSLPEQKKRIKMESILRNSKHLFEKNGFHETTISALCKGVMISKSTFFNYFGSKEKIIELIIEEDVREFGEHIDNLLSDPEADPVSVIRDTFAFLVNGSTTYPNITSVFYSLAMNDTVPDSRYKQLFTDYFEIEYKVIRNAQGKKAISDVYSAELIAQMFLGCILNNILRYPRNGLADRMYASIDELIEALLV